MRLPAWNIQSCGAARAEALVGEIARQDPDVVVLTEVRANSAPMLAALGARGWVHQVVGANKDGRGAAALLARTPLAPRTPAPTEAQFPGRWLEAEVPAAGLTVVGIYGPLDVEDHGAFWSLALHALAERREPPVLVAGDLNTGESLVDAPSAGFYCSEHFVALKALGFVDAWRAVNGDAREYNWFSRRGGKLLNGFRLDHALVSPILAPWLRTASYGHVAREAGHSDHAPLLVELEPT